MARVAGEAFYVAGLLLAEALRVHQRIARVRSSQSGRHAERPSRLPEVLVLGAVVLGIWILPLLSVFTSQLRSFDVVLPAWAVAIGAAVFASGLVIRWKAQTALGKQWSHTVETAPDHALVTGGIYGRIRHPIYASLILWATGQPLLLQNAVAGVGGAVAAGLIWFVRVPREEAMMLEHFGDAYRAYCARTGRLFPFPFWRAREAGHGRDLRPR